jgi:hypothetical protein
MAVIVERITMADVRNCKPEMIFYGAVTPWWTHDPNHLCFLPNGLPCDPRGGVLMQTDKVESFLSRAEAEPSFYGKHGLRTFMAAHHDNCQVSDTDTRRTCLTDWNEYNKALDVLIATYNK